MKKFTLDTSATIYNSIEDLPTNDRILMDKAIEAIKTSYSPYSKFKVGACLLLENGEYVSGSNQENAAYPSGMCAERVAFWRAGAQFPNVKIVSVAIAVKTEEKQVDKPVGPCGACRQSMFEFEFKQQENIKVLFMGEVGKVVQVESIKSLLPFSFDSSYLS